MIGQPMRTILFTALLLSTGHAQGLIQNLGGQRVGTSVFPFLKIEASATGAAMAGAAVAMPSDAAGAFYNPSIIPLLPRSSLVVSHLHWPADISYDSFAFSFHLWRHQYMALSYGVLQTEPFIETTEYMPFGTGRTFTFKDQVLSLTYGIRMTDRFSFGTSVKYVHEMLADVGMDAILFDFGTYYLTGLRSLRISSSFTNFGLQASPEGTYTKLVLDEQTGEEVEANLKYQAFSPPTMFRLGAAYELIDQASQQLTVAIQLNHPADNAEYYALGLNYQLKNTLCLRAGYLANADEFGFTLGAGIAVKFAGDRRVHFDYAYTQAAYLSSPQHLSIGFSL